VFPSDNTNSQRSEKSDSKSEKKSAKRDMSDRRTMRETERSGCVRADWSASEKKPLDLAVD